MKALLVVDMQNDFMSNGSLPVPQANQLIAPINQLMDDFNLVFATKDWHHANHVSFQTYPQHCVKSTKGAELAIDRNLINHILHKGETCESYSAFYNELGIPNSYCNLQGVTLERTLKKYYKVTDLYICGVALDICVKANALDAVKLGFNVKVLRTKKVKSYAPKIWHVVFDLKVIKS